MSNKFRGLVSLEAAGPFIVVAVVFLERVTCVTYRVLFLLFINCISFIAVRDLMCLGMQNFAFAQLKSRLPKSNHFCPNFAQI